MGIVAPDVLGTLMTNKFEIQSLLKTGGNEAVYQGVDELFEAADPKFQDIDSRLFNHEITWLTVMTNGAGMHAVASKLAEAGLVIFDLFARGKWHGTAESAYFSLGMKSDVYKRGWIRVPVVTASLPAGATTTGTSGQMPRFFNESIQYLNRKFNTLNFVHSTACVDQWRGRPGTKVGFLQQSALVGIRHNPGPRFDGDPTTADAPTPGHASQVVDLDPAAITEDSSACSAVLKQGLLSQVETHLLHSQVEQARVQGSETYETDFAEARLLHPGWFLNKPVPDDAGTLQHLADLHKRNIAELQELRSLVQNMPDADFRAYYGTSFPDSSVSGSAQADTFQTTIVTTNNAAVAAVLTALAPILPASRTGPLSNMPDPFQVTSSLAGTLIYYQMIYNREEAAYFVRRYKNVIQQLRKSQAADFTSSNVAGQTLVFHGSTKATNYTQHQAPAFEKDLLEALAQSKNPTELPTNINTIPFVYFLDKGAAATFIEQKLLSARAALDSSDQNKEVRSSLKQRAAQAVSL